MYEVTSQYVKDTIEGYNRTFRSYLDFGDFQIDGDHICSIKTDGGSTTQDDPAPGEIVSQTISLELDSIPQNISGLEFVWYIYITDIGGDDTDGTTITFIAGKFNTLAEMADYTLDEISKLYKCEPIPMGKYTVITCTNEGNRYNAECADKLCNLDSMFSSALTYPCRSNILETEILDKIGISLDRPYVEYKYLLTKTEQKIKTSDAKIILCQSNSFEINQKPVGYTYRQVLGFLAGMRGCFAVTDRVGNLTYRWYSQAQTVDLNKIDVPKFSETEYTYTKLICYVGENTTLTSGNGVRAIAFTNPFMTQARLDNICGQILPFLYYTTSLPYRNGDPRIDVWDILNVQGKSVPCMQTSYSFDGGVNLTIDATCSVETDANSENTLSQQINNAINSGDYVTIGQVVEMIADSMKTDEQINTLIGTYLTGNGYLTQTEIETLIDEKIGGTT